MDTISLDTDKILYTVISLYGLGVATYFLKGIPSTLYRLVKKQITTSIEITTPHSSLYNFMRWIEFSKYVNKLRVIRISNGKWGCEEEAIKGVGYGIHLFWYRNRPLILNYQRLETHTQYDKEMLTITKLGRNHNLLDDLVSRFSKHTEAYSSKTHIYGFGEVGWYKLQKYPSRDINSIYLSNTTKDKLLNILNKFGQSKHWYEQHNIPYRLGIALYGPSGTGKTSLIRAIGTYTSKNICILQPNDLTNIVKAIEVLPSNSILVIEDIDSNIVVHSRDHNDNQKTKHPLEELLKTNMSEVLNALDGIIDTSGRILITTTNHINKLDPAMLRPGRIDLSLEIGYVDSDAFIQFIKSFFPEVNPKETYKIVNELTIAKLQQEVLSGLTANQIINKYTIEED